MKNSQKGFVLPIFLAIIALLVIGGGVYVYENKKAEVPVIVDTGTQPPNQNQQKTNTQTTSPLPTPNPSPSSNLKQTLVKKTDSQSLISITEAHLKAVRQTLPGAELFEVSSFIPFKTKVVPDTNAVDLLIVKSYFVTTVDNVSFVEASEQFQNGKRTDYSTSTKGFI